MSGGVDSSVAAYILGEKGYECIGATMHLFDSETAGMCADSTCCSLDDVEDARLVCNRIGIRHYTFNFETDFRKEVIDRFVSTYEEGRTPNPCIDCNRYLKFHRLYDRCRDLDCAFIATGHYARIEYWENGERVEADNQNNSDPKETGKEPAGGRFRLRRAKDPAKDQSYVLYHLTQEQLARTLFPLGDMEKSETRSIAEEQGFINARKRDSQDICFVPDGDYSAAIRRFTGKEYPEGDFVDRQGNVLGRHKGLIRYTIGQRKGLGLALPEPMYVLRKDLAGNRVILARNEDLFEDELVAGDMNWIDFDDPPETFRCTARIRYSQKEAPATVTLITDGAAGGNDAAERDSEGNADIVSSSDKGHSSGATVRVKFDEPQRAISPGQAIVLYNGDYVIGGGTIAG